MVTPGDPSYCLASDPAPHRTGFHHRMVRLAPMSSGHGPEITFQTELATVMLVGVLLVLVCFDLRGLVGAIDGEQRMGKGDLGVVGGVMRVLQLVLGGFAVMKCRLFQMFDGGQVRLNVWMDFSHFILFLAYQC